MCVTLFEFAAVDNDVYAARPEECFPLTVAAAYLHQLQLRGSTECRTYCAKQLSNQVRKALSGCSRCRASHPQRCWRIGAANYCYILVFHQTSGGSSGGNSSSDGGSSTDPKEGSELDGQMGIGGPQGTEPPELPM